MLLLLPVIITILKVLNKYLVDFANNDIFTVSLPICDFSYSWLIKMVGTFSEQWWVIVVVAGIFAFFVTSSILSLKHLYNVKEENLPLLAPVGRWGEAW